MASKGRIFVVEDHATTARALAMYLETQGYHVSVADSVASALKHASQVSFDVLVCDIGLPDGNGWDLMKSLSATGPVRGIAFSASGSEDDIAKSEKAGFAKHLLKGSSAEELVLAIEEALDRGPSTRSRTAPLIDSRRATGGSLNTDRDGA